MENQQIPT